MKALITITAQVLKTKDGKCWVDGVYSYSFFKRYLQVFENIKLVCRVENKDNVDKKKYIELSGPNLEVYSLPFYHGPWNYAKNIFRIKKSLRKSFDDCDCAILRIPDEVSFSLLKLIKKKRKPICVEVVSDCWDFFRPGTFKTLLRPLLRMKWHFNQKKACKVSDCVSYVTEKYIQRRYPSNCDGNLRFESYYTSADMYDYFYKKPKVADDFFKDNCVHLVNVAGINSFAKGHKIMLDVVRMLLNEGIDVKFTFVGGGSKLDFFKSYAKNINVGSNVEFVGNVNDYLKIIDILSNNDIFIFPTKTEGLPRAVLEAMASGLPCISSRVGGVPELLDENFLVDFDDTYGFYSKIILLIKNKDIAIKQSENNFNKARLYSYGLINKKRIDLYSKLYNLVNIK